MPGVGGPRRSGFSLLELLIGITLLSLLSLFSVAYLTQGQRLWRRVESSSSAAQSLSKANASLSQDLINVGRDGVATMANGTGAQKMGDAIWFLSAYDPASQTYVRDGGGFSFWQKTILYYLTVPDDHDQRYGTQCVAWDQVCPHKILLRKVLDTGAVTTPTSAETDEEQLPDSATIAGYLTRPPSLNLGTLQAESGVVSVNYVAGYLLDLDVELTMDAGKVALVECVVRAALINDAKSHMRIGQDPFNKGTFTLSRAIEVVPRN
jgi:prepilin-type N-terminal cleavage/methylation domain-containing protein